LRGGERLNAVEIGNRLKALRGNRTIQEVSEATGIDTSTIGMYEIGQRIPRDNNKIILADYYGTTVQNLFFEPNITDGDNQ
jgi:transcriptional regulator with XRE-family HTH domain